MMTNRRMTAGLGTEATNALRPSSSMLHSAAAAIPTRTRAVRVLRAATGIDILLQAIWGKPVGG
jgi:hypothetical protein